MRSCVAGGTRSGWRGLDLGFSKVVVHCRGFFRADANDFLLVRRDVSLREKRGNHDFSHCSQRSRGIITVWTWAAKFTIPDRRSQEIDVGVTVGNADDMEKLIRNRSIGFALAMGLLLSSAFFPGCASFQDSASSSSYSRNKTSGWERFKKSSKRAWSKTWDVLDPYPDNPSPPPKWIPQPEAKKPESVQDFLGQPRVGT